MEEFLARFRGLDQARKTVIIVLAVVGLMLISTGLITFTIVNRELQPDTSLADSVACRKLGANFAIGTPVNPDSIILANRLGMGYGLEIATDPGQATAMGESFRRYEAAGLTPILRVCFMGSDCQFRDPDVYLNFIEQVSAASGGANFYVLAGPNEPLGEPWTGGSQGQPGEIGPPLAGYMNTIVAGVRERGLSNVKLLSPAFNSTHPEVENLIDSMQASGANFSALDGIALNAYNVRGYSLGETVTQQLDRIRGKLPGARYYITETGMYESERNADPLKSTPDVPHAEAVANLAGQAELLRNDPSVGAFLVFNLFRDNPDGNFTYNEMTDAEWAQVLGGCEFGSGDVDLPPPGAAPPDGGGSSNDGGTPLPPPSSGGGACPFPAFIMRVTSSDTEGLIDANSRGYSVEAGARIKIVLLGNTEPPLDRWFIADAVIRYAGAGISGERELLGDGFYLRPTEAGILEVTHSNYGECGQQRAIIEVTGDPVTDMGDCEFNEFELLVNREGDDNFVGDGETLRLGLGERIRILVTEDTSGDPAEGVINSAAITYEGAGLSNRSELGGDGFILAPRSEGELVIETLNFEECGVQTVRVAVGTESETPAPAPTPSPAPAPSPSPAPAPAPTPSPIRPGADLPETSLDGQTALYLFGSAVSLALAGVLIWRYLLPKDRARAGT